MGFELIRVLYTDEEINEITQKLFLDYNGLLFSKKAPKAAVLNVARLLEQYPQTEDNKLNVLEFVSRYKCELKLLSSGLKIDERLSKSPVSYAFKYGKNEYAIKMALNYFYGSNKNFIYSFPVPIQSCINRVIFKMGDQENIHEKHM